MSELKVWKFLEKLNNEIKEKKGKDFTIGHAYFLPLKEDMTPERFVEILRKSVLPLLQEYFYDDWETLISILAGGSSQRDKISKLIIDKYGEIKLPKNKTYEIVEILINFTERNNNEQSTNQV
ncbi:hypothetical protein [Thermovibrio sp.]